MEIIKAICDFWHTLQYIGVLLGIIIMILYIILWPFAKIFNWKEIVKERQAEKFYQDAVLCLERRDFSGAELLINKAIKGVDEIAKVLTDVSGTGKYDKYNLFLGNIYQKWGHFNDAITAYNKVTKNSNDLYAQAQEGIREIEKIRFQAHEKLKQKQQKQSNNQKIVNKEPHSYKHSHKNTKIILESCSANELLAIDGIDRTKAARFVKERSEGKKYYDIETFSATFGLQPHQMIFAMEKLVFPVKTKNKIGRKIDW